MSAIEEALKHLIRTNGDVTSNIINDLIKDHSPDRERMARLYERYKASSYGVPILTREFLDRKKVNNKLANDFFGEVIDIKVGYFAGEPISYTIDKETENHEKATEALKKFKQVNNVPDMDAETTKMASICGHGARLCYIDRDGQERAMNVDPWECIFITDMSINEPQYAMRYYKITDNGKERWRVEWYDNTYITYYVQSDTGQFIVDETEPQRQHFFDEVPLMGFPNNEECIGDAEKVLSLIDGYDRTLSDVSSEIEQFRLAYMAFYGVEPDEETIERARRTGAFGLDAEGKIEFITKDLNDQIIENHLDRVGNNIYRFSKTPNFADEAFAGSQSGEARKYKMLPFENKCVTSERKFTAGLRQMFKVITSAWVKKGVSVDYTDIEMTFTRNFPLDLRYEAETQQMLKGLVSEKTRLSLFSGVEDPEAEIEEMEAEQVVDLDNYGGGDNEPVE